jgi:ABC-2 type transport system ATP-binding protein
MNGIEFKGVHHRFGDNQVLRGLDLEVAEGEVVALLGRNGAGKTTSIQTLLGFLEPDAGEARLLGTPSLELGPEQRERVGFVSEGHKLYGWMRLSRVLDFEAATRRKFDRGAAERTLKALGLGLKQWVQTLSRGQRAQVALTVALAGDPDVLILDDPAMGLDAVMRRDFLDAMIDLLGQEGRCVLFSSHILSDVERVADRVAILHEGSLVVNAELDELRSRVKRRFVTCEPGAEPPPAHFEGVLRCQRKREGFELLTVDWSPETEAEAHAMGWRWSEPVGTNLEELFFDLTVADSKGDLTRALSGGVA